MRRLLVAVSIWVLVPAVAVAAATAAVPGTEVSGTFKGKSSQGKQVIFKLVGGNIEGSTFTWFATCMKHGVAFGGTTQFAGRLTGDNYYVHDTHRGPVQGGYQAKRTETARFTVAGHSLKGTCKLVAILYTASGAQDTTCSTPEISFKLKS